MKANRRSDLQLFTLPILSILSKCSCGYPANPANPRDPVFAVGMRELDIQGQELFDIQYNRQ